MQVKLEICIDSVDGALAAEAGGADRLELCGSLLEGGTTPSTGLIRRVLSTTSLPVMVMVRPRGGTFCYRPSELQTLIAEADAVLAESIAGIVIGSLTTSGEIDLPSCRRLRQMAGHRSVTFHRAIDQVRDVEMALRQLIDLGIDRVLTSGQAPTAPLGIPVIRALVEQAADKIIVMPGCGVRAENVTSILAETQATEIHCSASTAERLPDCFWRADVPMGAASINAADEFLRRVTRQEYVQAIRNQIDGRNADS